MLHIFKNNIRSSTVCIAWSLPRVRTKRDVVNSYSRPTLGEFVTALFLLPAESKQITATATEYFHRIGSSFLAQLSCHMNRALRNDEISDPWIT